MRKFEGGEASITSLVFLKNAQILMSASYDSKIKFWNIIDAS